MVSEANGAAFAAFTEAKTKLATTPIPKNRTARVKMKNGGEYTFKYADLNDVLKIVSPILGEQGCYLTHPTGDGITSAEVRYKDGTLIERASWQVPTTNDPQALGSALTYLKRYLTYCVLGIHPDEDDDGAGLRRDQERGQRKPWDASKAKGGQQPTNGPAKREQAKSGKFWGVIESVEQHGEVYAIKVADRKKAMHTTDEAIGVEAMQSAGTGEEVHIAFELDGDQPMCNGIETQKQGEA